MSVGIRIRKEGSLDGLGEQAWNELRPRAISAVEEANRRTLTTLRSLLSRGGEPEAGQPPRMRTGELMRSWRETELVKRRYSIRKGVESDHPAATILEFGGTGRGGEKRLPRPYLRPTFERLRSVYDRIFEKV